MLSDGLRTGVVDGPGEDVLLLVRQVVVEDPEVQLLLREMDLENGVQAIQHAPEANRVCGSQAPGGDRGRYSPRRSTRRRTVACSWRIGAIECRSPMRRSSSPYSALSIVAM